MSTTELTETSEVSRYVTVFQQTKDTENGEAGDRFVVHGEDTDRKYQLEDGDFITFARPLAVLEVGTDLHEDELGEWVNSHAGKALLAHYFPNEFERPLIRDTEGLVSDYDTKEDDIVEGSE